MLTDEFIKKIKSKLRNGDIKSIAQREGINISTAYAFFEMRKIKPISYEKSCKLLECAVSLIEERERKENELNNKINNL